MRRLCDFKGGEDTNRPLLRPDQLHEAGERGRSVTAGQRGRAQQRERELADRLLVLHDALQAEVLGVEALRDGGVVHVQRRLIEKGVGGCDGAGGAKRKEGRCDHHGVER